MTDILIHQTADTCQVAILDNEKLQDFFVETVPCKSLVGSIYVGTVVRVVTGLQAVFVDIGEARTAFLSKDDVVMANRLIERCFYQGEKVLVQVIKDPVGDKGARLSTDIALSSKHLVYRPYGKNSISISRKISDKTEKKRLLGELGAIKENMGVDGAVIARTRAGTVSQEALRQDLHVLFTCWRTILAEKQMIKKPALLYQKPSLAVRCINEYANNIDKIITDNQALFDELKTTMAQENPNLIDVLSLHTTPSLFSQAVKSELLTVMGRKITLKSKGYIIIDETEAMTVIDVNTGSFIGQDSLEQTAYDINIEASYAIARIVRLRNLSGIIVIDFIDMKNKANKQALVQSLSDAFMNDFAEINILPMSDIGLVQMTRKRTYGTLTEHFYTQCPTCKGSGLVPRH